MISAECSTGCGRQLGQAGSGVIFRASSVRGGWCTSRCGAVWRLAYSRLWWRTRRRSCASGRGAKASRRRCASTAARCNRRRRAEPALAEQVQQITGLTVELAYVDHGYTGSNAAEAAQQHGIPLEVVKHLLGKTRLRSAGPAMGGRKELRLGCSLPKTRRRLPTAQRHTQRLPLHRLRNTRRNKNDQHCKYKYLTASK